MQVGPETALVAWAAVKERAVAAAASACSFGSADPPFSTTGAGR